MKSITRLVKIPLSFYVNEHRRDFTFAKDVYRGLFAILSQTTGSNASMVRVSGCFVARIHSFALNYQQTDGEPVIYRENPSKCGQRRVSHFSSCPVFTRLSESFNIYLSPPESPVRILKILFERENYFNASWYTTLFVSHPRTQINRGCYSMLDISVNLDSIGNFYMTK